MTTSYTILVPTRNWGALASFFAANILFAAGLFAHGFLYNFYLDGLGLPEGVMGIAAASLTAGGIAALVPAGMLVDRRGPGAAYLLAAGLAAAGLVAGAFVERPATIYGAAFLAGAGTATWRVMLGPAVMRLAPDRIRSRAFSWNVALLVGSGAFWTWSVGRLPAWLEAAAGLEGLDALRGALVLGAAGTALSAAVVAGAGLQRRASAAPRADDGQGQAAGSAAGESAQAAMDSPRAAAHPFTGGAATAGGAATGGGAAAGGVPATGLGPETAGEAAPPGGVPATGMGPEAAGEAAPAGPLATLRIPASLALLVLLVLVWMMAGGMVIPFMNLYFLRVHELPIGRIGLLFALAQVLTAFLLFGSGEVAGQMGPRRALFGWMLVFSPALWALAAVDSVTLAMVFYFIQGVVPPATNPLIDQILLERAPPERQGAVSSWRNLATELSGLLGSSAGGFMLQAGSFALLFGVAGGVAAVGALGLFVALGWWPAVQRSQS